MDISNLRRHRARTFRSICPLNPSLVSLIRFRSLTPRRPLQVNELIRNDRFKDQDRLLVVVVVLWQPSCTQWLADRHASLSLTPALLHESFFSRLQSFVSRWAGRDAVAAT